MDTCAEQGFINLHKDLKIYAFQWQKNTCEVAVQLLGSQFVLPLSALGYLLCTYLTISPSDRWKWSGNTFNSNCLSRSHQDHPKSLRREFDWTGFSFSSTCGQGSLCKSVKRLVRKELCGEDKIPRNGFELFSEQEQLLIPLWRKILTHTVSDPVYLYTQRITPSFAEVGPNTDIEPCDYHLV